MHHYSKQQKVRTAVVVLLALMLIISAICLGTLRKGETGTDLLVPNAGIVKGLDEERKYFVGDPFTVPQAEISYEGKTYPAESSLVIFPDKSATRKQSFVLSDGGMYVIQYSATANGKKITAKESFVVNQRILSFSGEKSSAQYGTHSVYATEKEGLITKIARGETLYFNQAVDLSELSEKNAQMTFFAAPSQIGVPDATNLRVRFTDAYDSENYVEVELRDVSFVQGEWAIHHTYTVAKASSQPFKGIEGSTIHYNDPFGHPCEFSLSGVPMGGGEPGSENFILKFDYHKKQILDKAGMIIDLDDAAYYTDLWEGFSTGECFISIYAEMYQSTHVNLGITELFGIDLSSQGFTDRQPPVITVETAGTDETALPNALKGVAYRLFPASAFDVQDGNCKVETFVTYDYQGKQVNVDVRDGVFIPERAWEYTISYRAADRSGNNAVKELKVSCPSGGEGLEFTIENPNRDIGKAGCEYRVCDSVLYKNASGHATVTVTAQLKNGDDTYEIDAEDFSFVPMSKGVYVVTVVCEDYLQTVEETFEVEIGVSDEPKIFDTPALPEYFILGARYRLPELESYDFTTGNAQVKYAEVRVSEDGGEPVAISDGMYQVRAEKNVRVVYIAKAGANETSVWKDIPVIDVGYGAQLDYAKYFHATAGKIERIQNSLDLELITRTDSSSAEFINPLIADGFEFNFNVNGTKNKFSRFNIYLTDSIDRSERVLVSFAKGSGGIAVANVNGGQSYNLKSNFNGTGDNFLLVYDSSSGSVRLSSTLSIPVNTYQNGREFNGFSSGKVYLRLEFAEVSGESAIHVFSLNGTSFAQFDSDFFAPTISCKDMRGNKGLGDTIVLEPAMAADVLDPNVTFILRVTGPDDKPVTSVEGIVLDGTCDPGKTYTVRLSSYGDYNVVYEASDSSGNSVSESYGISVEDTVAPQIVLEEDYTAAAKVGDTVSIAEFKASDDYSETLNIYIFIVSPFGNLYRLDGNAFEAVVRGTYTVLITVYDENNNFAMAKYDVKVA